jgi:hypothetical protein
VKEGYYALGGAVAGAVTGFLLGKGKGGKVDVPKDIAAEVAKLTAFVLPTGVAPVALTIKPVLKYVQFTNVDSVMYALVYNGLGNVDNPEAVMSVSISGDLVTFEFGQQAGNDVVVYRDTTQLVMLSGLMRLVTVPQ